MKYIKSKKLSKSKYLLTLEVTEHDLNMLEDLATTYAPFQYYQDNKDKLYSNRSISLIKLDNLDFTDEYRKWILKTWKTFWKLWEQHDG